MKKININLQNHEKWKSVGPTYWNGNAFYKGQFLNESSIFHIPSLSNARKLVLFLSELNGFFALIQQSKDIIYAAVDRVRSIPLFYSLSNGDFYISDNAHWIQEEIKSSEIGEIVAAEFLLTGYVTGSDTLYSDIKQLQAGEALILQRKHDGLLLKTIRYYRYVPGNYSSSSEVDLLSELDQVLLRVFKRLIKYASGRTIVVPLSGGYDSRLIVLMLKRLGYSNMVAFSYGKPGNKESEISKKVAQLLGIRWLFVPYSNEDWHRWYRSEAFKEYCWMACGLSSVPHIQDWPAVRELGKNGLIPKESIIVPGHSADLLTGSRSSGQPELYIEKAETIDPIEAILGYHYRLWHMSEDQIQRFQFRNRIVSCIGDTNQFADNSGAFEYWDVSERQSKFIINSVRVYEFWGYSWWIPFWDAEFMDFWSKVPVNMKLGQKIYKIYVNNKFKELSNSNSGQIHENRSSRTLLFKSAISLLKRTPFIGVVRNIHRRYKIISEYERSALSIYGSIPKERFTEMYTGVENFNSFFAADIMESLFSDSENAKYVLHEIAIAEK